MSSGRVSKYARKAAVVLMVGSAIAVIAILTLGSFVFADYDAYGEVAVPGTGKVHLPAGDVTVDFHTVTVGNASGGLPLPELGLDIDPPAGVANPKVTENFGSSTSVNNDVHRRVWVVQIPVDGDYVITTTGQINGFISPRLAFGYDMDPDNSWLMICAGLFVIGLVYTVTAAILRNRSRPEPTAWQANTSHRGATIEQLKTLAALRDSGALTEDEFQAEKRRVLDGD